MSVDSRVAMGSIYLQIALLAVLELLYLPLRLDGTLLPRLNDWPFPVAVAVGIVTTPLLIMAASRYTQSVLFAASPLLVWLITLLCFGVMGPGGDVLLRDDWRGAALVGGTVLSSILAVFSVIIKRIVAGPRDHPTRDDPKQTYPTESQPQRVGSV